MKEIEQTSSDDHPRLVVLHLDFLSSGYDELLL